MGALFLAQHILYRPPFCHAWDSVSHPDMSDRLATPIRKHAIVPQKRVAALTARKKKTLSSRKGVAANILHKEWYVMVKPITETTKKPHVPRVKTCQSRPRLFENPRELMIVVNT